MKNNQLLKCPFCGKTDFVKLADENTVNLLTPDDEEYTKYPLSVVICAMAEHAGDKGGCGSSSGYYLDPKDAIMAWNRRE